MTPKLTKAMAKAAVDDGAEVKQKRKMPKPTRAPAPVTPITPDRGPELKALRDEISQLKQALADEKIASQGRSQDLAGVIAALSEHKPLRLKPIRDMDKKSETYLLVSHYDFIPVTYQRKLDS
ncbi:MAG: hypothetical protein JRJ19_15855 [Deltaproteobacteria bacterium]|nr:hypothetical protein [Deltaproteobacteria bacterium]